MSTITGTVHFDFDTDRSITKEQFKIFKEKIEELVEDFEMQVYEAASESGFEADSVAPVFLDDLDCDFENK